MLTRTVVAAMLSLAALASASRAAEQEVAVVSTPEGEIVFRLFDREAPKHAAYVRELIARGFYDGTLFHRVIPHFVIQGGDPLSLNDDRGDDGSGEGDRRLPAEFSTTLHYVPGTVGMARDTDPDSGSCQFFIALENLPRLDTRYTIFGEVVAGLDVARRIAGRPRDVRDNPLDRVPIRARLARREVPEAVRSLGTGPSGEVLTGPDKPRHYDPGNTLWKPPALRTPPGEKPASAVTRLDVAVGEDGSVLDVRFLDARIPASLAETLRASASAWHFSPATYEGRPRKTRIEIDADGGRIGPPTAGGAPLPLGEGVHPPAPAVRVELPAGTHPPAVAPRLRLTVDAAGTVTDAALQVSCGNAALDAASVEAAKKLVFVPATQPASGGAEPEPIAVYLDVEVRWAAMP